ncbi:MAG: bifunctional YncE family protein/alkaline phosphatase family protein [Vicinamibacteria bacterium]|nr:bifunctional YncE family protein/alkaline phosphatase family protein [Vicinamibacteria bacterium]
MNLVMSPDGAHLVVTNNGYSQPNLVVYDHTRQFARSRVLLESAWLGLAFHPDGKRLYSSGSARNRVDEFSWDRGALKSIGDIPLPKPANDSFVGGLAVSPDGRRLYAVHVLGEKLHAIDLDTRTVIKTVDLSAEPYTVLVSPDSRFVYLSLWGGAKVQVFDAADLSLKHEIEVGEHPSAMALSKDGSRLYVACANTNAVWNIDLGKGYATEQIGIAPFPNMPPGSTPNALDLSPDGKTLLVANADNNTLAVVDLDAGGKGEVEGFIPTGWYPTGVRFSLDGKKIFILSGKGLTSAANPRGRNPGAGTGPDAQYSGAMFWGALTTLDAPDHAKLKEYTATALYLTPDTGKSRLAPAKAPQRSVIPTRVGGSSPIKHVFYVIRENRTYDQVFGDLPQGNGDPSLTLFGENVTPNAHALVRQFVLLDNFYVDAEVSYDGHAFSTGAWATDAVEKIWPINYGRREGRYLSEGGGAMRNPYGNLAAGPRGYIWDAAARANVSYRSYGEFSIPGAEIRWDEEVKPPFFGSVPGLKDHVHPTYPPYNLSIPDNRRIDVWLEEFREFEKNNTLPRLNILRLGNDHTAGSRTGSRTPRAMVAENDQALGRLVEAISRSRYWQESAIFVLEDDAQNGPDHVDAHRSLGLVISPYTQRQGLVDSTLYTTSGFLRTMELILGLEPLSQYDAAATPLYNAFALAPNAAPYAALSPRIDITEMNDPDAWGAAESAEMDLSEADRAPDLLLNEIVWRSVRGARSRMPPPVRAAWLKRGVGDDDDGEQKTNQSPTTRPRNRP